MPGTPKVLKLLVVEDNPAYIFLVKETLGQFKSENYEIKKEYAMNGAEALEKFKQFDPDVTFLDINLPDSSGLDLLKAFLEMRENAFITMLTSEAQASTVQQACSRGAQGYILKPFTVSKIKEALAKFHDTPKTDRKKLTMPKVNPAVKTDLQAVSEKEKPKKPVPTLHEVFSSWRILLADGDLGRQARVLEALQTLGCKARVVSSGAHAWDVLQSEHFDIVLIDVNLPEIDGYQISNQLRLTENKKPIKTHVIALYANQAQVNQKRMQFSGMVDCFVSPLNVQKFRDTFKAYAKKFLASLEQMYVN